MNSIGKILLLGILIYGLSACSRKDFLDEKPNSGILNPSSLNDVQKLLDNNVMNNLSSGLAQMAADEYDVDYQGWEAATVIERNSYIWAKDIYEGTPQIRDWNSPFSAVFYANNALEILNGLEQQKAKGSDYNNVLGQALFKRAFANYELLRSFCKSYDANTAATDLGIPIRRNAGIDEIVQRANLADSYSHILSDLQKAALLLPKERLNSNLFRPTRVATYALLARIYLDMGIYEQAGKYADSTLNSYHTLIDYNKVSATSLTPFSITNDELIYNVTTVGLYYFSSLGSLPRPYRVSKDLINLYDQDDLRLQIFFISDNEGSYVMKRGYYGAGAYPFTGLATDEIYLIKAECLARDGKDNEALMMVWQVLKNRYRTGKAPAIAELAEEGKALDFVLRERRKELVWRCLRWNDLKRLNRDGYNITLRRTLGEGQYILNPNDPRYVFPIPQDEIDYSGIQQNER